MAAGFEQGGWASTADVINLGVPLGNRSDLPVRLHRVTFATRSPHVHLIRVIAFRLDRFGYLAASLGDFNQHCRPAYHPGPPTNVVLSPHADSAWEVMVEFRIDAPGRYVVGPVRISYAEAGRIGWQNQNLNTIMVISAARPGRKPAFNGC